MRSVRSDGGSWSCTVASGRPASERWTWQSMSPGSIVAPGRSTRVASAGASIRLPMALIRSPSTSTAPGRSGGPGVFAQQTAPAGVCQRGIEKEAEEHDVGPVREKRQPETDELGQQRRREGHQCDRREKAELDPGQIAVGFGEVVQLRLLSVPEDAQREEAQQIRHQRRPQTEQRVPEIML